jgi:hypothetical protein
MFTKNCDSPVSFGAIRSVRRLVQQKSKMAGQSVLSIGLKFRLFLVSCYSCAFGMNLLSKQKSVVRLNRWMLRGGLSITFVYGCLLPFTLTSYNVALVIGMFFLSLMRFVSGLYVCLSEATIRLTLQQMLDFTGDNLQLLHCSASLFVFFVLYNAFTLFFLFYFNWSRDMPVLFLHNWVARWSDIDSFSLLTLDMICIVHLKQCLTFTSTSYIAAFILVRQAFQNLQNHFHRVVQSHRPLLGVDFELFWDQCERYVQIRQDVQRTCGPLIAIFYFGLFCTTSMYFIIAIALQPTYHHLVTFCFYYFGTFLIPIFYSTFLIGKIQFQQQLLQRRMLELLNPIGNQSSRFSLSQPKRLAYLQMVRDHLDEPFTAWNMFSINRALPFHFFNTNASFVVMAYNLIGDDLQEMFRDWKSANITVTS